MNLNSSPEAANYSRTIGHVVRILGRSASFRNFPLSAAIAFLDAPIALKQIKVFHDRRGEPIGFTAWAYLDRETETRTLYSQELLHPSEYLGGPKLWLTEVYVPRQFFHEVRSYLDRVLFPQDSVVFYVQRHANGRASCIHKWKRTPSGVRKYKLNLMAGFDAFLVDLFLGDDARGEL